jgi:hypothetical protein
VFLFYEKFPASGDIPQVTQVVLSSNGRDHFINWKNKAEEATINLVRNIFKQVPIKERDMDEKLYIWTFIGFRGDVLLEGIKSFQTQGVLQNIELKEISDLSDKVKLGRLNVKNLSVVNEEKKFQDEDFFHRGEAINSLDPTGAVLLERLAPLLNVSVSYLTNESDRGILKKLYRAAAMKLHPDRNNNDSAPMTELNYLWNIFNSGV